MKKKIANTFFLTIIISNLIITQSCGLESGSDCFGASTPVDLMLRNPMDKKVKVTLLELTDKNEYKIIGKLTLKPNQNKNICLEYESPISKGLYIYADKTLSRLILSTS